MKPAITTSWRRAVLIFSQPLVRAPRKVFAAFALGHNSFKALLERLLEEFLTPCCERWGLKDGSGCFQQAAQAPLRSSSVRVAQLTLQKYEVEDAVA